MVLYQFQQAGNEEFRSRKKIEKNSKLQDAGTVANGTVAAGEKPGFSLCIAKISLGLRKFHNHSENFAILAKFSLCKIFAKLAKFR